MVISKHFHEVGIIPIADRVELLENRVSYMTSDYIKRFKHSISGIKLSGRVAVLYAAGASLHQGESRCYRGEYTNSLDIQSSGPIIKELTAYMLHSYIGLLNADNDIVYANINSNTCASSMHSIWEAKQLIDNGIVEHAIVIAEEKTSFNTIRIFHEHQINVIPGEGFALIVVSKEGNGIPLLDAKWEYSYNRNPFLVDTVGYQKVKCESDIVKGHQTGTEQNDTAEKEVFGNVIGYKDKIGHCQGASGLIELCMVLDDDKLKGKILCTASGLGGFYGSCLVEK